MAAEAQAKENAVAWPSEPRSYQWKGTLSISNNTWIVLAHCKPRKEDVVLKIKQTQDLNDEEIYHFTESTKTLINIQHTNLLTPVHAFVNKTEIWVIYPRHSGGPLIEALTSHYPNGIPDESIVASILYDVASGLQNLHKQQQCHRNIRAASIHVDIDQGISLLAEFEALRSIRYKDKNQKRDTIVPMERRPFTDPLILREDPKASWYAGDIYAFGITALQLTYGSTPPLNAKSLFQTVLISTDLYDKKCPFSKAFEQLIKDCCAPSLEERISVIKLCEHKFFKNKAEPLSITQYLSHILKSTEKRINSSLQSPPCFDLNSSMQNLQNGIAPETSMESQPSNTVATNASNVAASATKSEQTPNGHNTDNSKDGGTTMTNGGSQSDAVEDPSWTFSTSLKKSDIDMKIQNELNNGTQAVNEDQSTDDQPAQKQPSGPNMHQVPATGFNDPSKQHTATATSTSTSSQPKPYEETKIDLSEVPKKRNYHVSFSENEFSLSTPEPEAAQDANAYDKDKTVQINRFKVEFGSRLSESGTAAGQIEPSLTEEHYDPEAPQHEHSDPEEYPEMQPREDSHSASANEKSTKIRRFIVTPAKPELSADEADDSNNDGNAAAANNNGNQPAPQQQAAPQQPQQPQPQPPPQEPAQQQAAAEVASIPDNTEGGWTPPSADKSTWSAQQCSEWVANLGGAYVAYKEHFVENGIDGAFFAELDDSILTEIIPSALHRRKILSAWGKLQEN
mmetsp:Transcript_31174/g.50118  ORF Transcript_31174/g.50118 Transcript_31174/m.50118 type:complete len:737 (+) Transcript_31174:177-2387(+)